MVYHLPTSPASSAKQSRGSIDLVVGAFLTSGTASLSAWELAASVVTVLFASADLESALLRRGAARPVLNARENMTVVARRIMAVREKVILKLLRITGPKDVGPLRWRLNIFRLARVELYIVT
jgi:hypothetical protein